MSRPAVAHDQGWRNSAVHREVDNRHARWVFRVVLGVAIALAPLAFYLLQTMSFVKLGYAIEDARGREARLIEWEHRLTIEKDLLQSLPEVEKHAAARLGLSPAPAAQVVVVSPGELRARRPTGDPLHRPPLH